MRRWRLVEIGVVETERKKRRSVYMQEQTRRRRKLAQGGQDAIGRRETAGEGERAEGACLCSVAGAVSVPGTCGSVTSVTIQSISAVAQMQFAY
jgi:hypothetical protein